MERENYRNHQVTEGLAVTNQEGRFKRRYFNNYGQIMTEEIGENGNPDDHLKLEEFIFLL